MQNFTCFTTSPMDGAHVNLALATIQAGGIAILDAEFCTDLSQPRAGENLAELMDAATRLMPDQACMGVKLRAEQLEQFHALPIPRATTPHWLILTQWTAADLQRLEAPAHQHLLLEITNIAALEELPASVSVRGIVAKGNEAGGRVGEDSAFVLAQKLLAHTQVPIYVQGGIGIYTAAACRAGGAAGVILDDQCWLMPESPLEQAWQQELARVNGQETVVLGTRVGQRMRVLLRPGLAGANALRAAEQQLEIDDDDDPASLAERWHALAEHTIGWNDPAEFAWPVGQAVGQARDLYERYRTTGRLIQAVFEESYMYLTLAQELQPLAPGSPLAVSHGTHYPIIQGPMTRVSDTAAFAHAVAGAGALPMLALAMMPYDRVMPLLEETQDKLGDRPWGVGILGFVSPEVRAAQMRAVFAAKPRFAIIAGGRPDQVADAESRGIAAYVHVPVPALLPMYLAQGVRRFIFEGRECGGHIGPLTSFALWDSMIHALLAHVQEQDAATVHVVFAGGIHDERSAAMVAAMAAPLAAAGMKIGVLMGTAYLFTQEAVRDGAIVAPFQHEAVNCRQTIDLEISPGHAIRCVNTPFTQEFYAKRRQLLRAQTAPREVKEQLENLTLGRLRIASKGIQRNAGGEHVAIKSDEQVARGMYMIGQVATLHQDIMPIHELHRRVSEGGAVWLTAAQPRITERQAAMFPEERREGDDIAIIGLSLVMPGAQETETYWRNILDKVSSIAEIPPTHWDWRLQFSDDPNEADHIASKWGGFIDDVPFDPMRFGIPPRALSSISLLQLIMLETVRRALEDSGYAGHDYDHEHTAVVVGTDGSNPLTDLYGLRTTLLRFRDELDPELFRILPPITEESMPGTLANVVSGRVANRFDFGGPNFTVDAACASSLTALAIGCQELAAHNCDLMVVGGADLTQTLFSYHGFSRTRALSPTGSALPFDKKANGIVISEGFGVVVLKRLNEALRDGDRVYAVVKGVGKSSDGKGRGLTAPQPIGQLRAFTRAYAKTGFSPRTIGLYEAHGTGTVVGDRAELETITTTLHNAGAAPQTCAIGSVKSLIGHTKNAAGIAGLIKVAMALYHRTLPPHAQVTMPLDGITDEESPVYMLKEPRPWLAHPDHPRRAAVSAFGFGGVNAHVVLEEHAHSMAQGDNGAANWPFELFLFYCADADELTQQIDRLLADLQAGAAPRPADLAYTLAHKAAAAQVQSGRSQARVAIVARDLAELGQSLATVQAHLHTPETSLPDTITVNLATPRQAPKLAFLFPGQGAQEPNMVRETALFVGELRAALEDADAILDARYPRLLSSYVYPPGAYTPGTAIRQQTQLTNTHVAQPAIGAVSAGLLGLMGRLDIQPQMAAGHSFGELTALFASGALSYRDFINLAERRGHAMAQCNVEGGMAAVHASRADVERLLAELPELVFAGHNAPNQCTISGETSELRMAVERLQAAKIHMDMLPVSGPFHSPLMLPALDPLTDAIRATPWQPPLLPVYSNVGGAVYANDAHATRTHLEGHLLQPVDFVGQIQKMVADGAQIFVEVGPRTILSDLTRRIVNDATITVLALDGMGGGMRGLLAALGKLLCHGVHSAPHQLFAARRVQLVDLDNLVATTAPVPYSPTTMLANGATIRRPGDAPSQPLPITSLRKYVKGRQEIDAPVAPHDETSSYVNNSVEPMHPPMPQSPTEQTAATETAVPPAPHVALAATPHAASIVAAFEAHQATMRQFLQTQEAILREFLGASPTTGPTDPMIPETAPAMPVQPHAGLYASKEPPVASAKVAQAQQPPAEAPAAAAQPQLTPTAAALAIGDRDALTESLRAIVVDRTGYPPEMIGDTLDLEAELGVDSIKRIEILESFKGLMPKSLVAVMQEHFESLVGASSLTQIVDVLVARSGVGGDTVDAVTVGDVGVTGEESAGNAFGDSVGAGVDASADAEVTVLDTACPRFVVRSRMQSRPDRRVAALSGLYLITEDGMGVAPQVAARLHRLGAETAIIARGQLVSHEAVETALLQGHRQGGPIRGIVHLAPLVARAMPDTLDAWKQTTQQDSKSLFQLLHMCAADLGTSDATAHQVVVAASFMGGYFGRDGTMEPGLPSGGSSVGLLKSLRIEWPHLHVRALDFDGFLDASEMAALITAELLCTDATVEVGYPMGMRAVPEIVAKPLAFDATARQYPVPATDWVALVTGGARGITAAIAQRMVVPGMTLHLVGRTPLAAPESAELSMLTDVQALRGHFIEAARARNAQATPVDIENEVRALLAQREIRANLAQLEAQGARVEYHAMDVRDEAAMQTLLRNIYARDGRVDTVIHGAGVIADRRLADKDTVSFDRVFDTKADSIYLLSRHLRPESLKHVVLFGSVAGRYGNAGQTDYAAANELLNRFGWWLHGQWPHVHVTTINWGPWTGIGMADAAVMGELRKRGIMPVAPESGIRFFLDELVHGDGASEVLAGDGPWRQTDVGQTDESYDLHALFHEIDAAMEHIWRSRDT